MVDSEREGEKMVHVLYDADDETASEKEELYIYHNNYIILNILDMMQARAHNIEIIYSYIL